MSLGPSTYCSELLLSISGLSIVHTYSAQSHGQMMTAVARGFVQWLQHALVMSLSVIGVILYLIEFGTVQVLPGNADSARPCCSHRISCDLEALDQTAALQTLLAHSLDGRL